MSDKVKTPTIQEETKLTPAVTRLTSELTPQDSTRLTPALSPELSPDATELSPGLSPDATELSPALSPELTPALSPELSPDATGLNPPFSPDATESNSPFTGVNQEQSPELNPAFTGVNPDATGLNQEVNSEERVGLSPAVSPAFTELDKKDEPVVKTSEQITLTIDKSTLVSLCQNLNTNLLVNIAAYKSVLAKLKDSEKDETKVGELDSNITNLNEIESSVSNLLNTVQTSLDVPKDKQIDPQTVIQEASSSGSGDFMQKVMGAEAAAVLGSMAAATVLALGGAKRKITKRRRNKGRKSTKRHKK